MRCEKEVIGTVVGPEIADDVMRSAGSAQEGYPSDYIDKMPVARVVGLLEAVGMAAEAKENV